jgi:plasmid stability protein
MIPYDLIVTASHRPHLLEPTLTSLLTGVDQLPRRVLIHDDAVARFVASPAGEPAGDPLVAAREATRAVLTKLDLPMPVIYRWADPPQRLGVALRWLLQIDTVLAHPELEAEQAEYLLYSQDDFVTVRPLPIVAALEIMDAHHIHQIRFNKRATLGEKQTWQGRWQKEEVEFMLPPWATPLPDGAHPFGARKLTIADHWYFQTGLWRAAPIRAAIAWLTETAERRAILREMLAEEAVNHVMDGRFGSIPGLTVPRPDAAMLPEVRRQVQRTFIWGGIGEDRYIRHIGGADPTVERERDGGVDDPAVAWREIESYDHKSMED